MSKHLGDYDASAVIYGKFTTYRPSTGASFTLGGTPALSVYKDNSTTQSTTGVTLTADFDSVTGLNHFAIDTSADGTFYAAGSFFDIVITTGTVDSVSVTGSVVASFTIRKDSSLKPTTAARTLDVSAGGEAGVDWANVGSPTTSLALTGTTIATTQKVDVETIKTNPVVNAGTVTFPTTATLASTTNITAGTITTTTNLTNLPSIPANWITAAGITAAALNGKGNWNVGKTGYALTATTGLGNQTSNITGSLSGSVGSVTGAVGSVTGNVGGNVTGSVGSVVGAVGSVTGNVGGNVVGSVASVTAAVAITSNVKKNQALAKFQFLMTDSTNHAPSTGLTVTATRSIDGAAFAAGTLSAVTEIGNGMYYVDFGAGDLNGNVITLQATAAASDTTFATIVTQP